ncbi:beta-1,4-galactosyltransferase 7-like [Bombyx mandarina]|uniref:Beta-1,4-N-acetylgalactosaminyltransferase n=1 Tax=Bombyx mandarina TaxID=7092 RepID=A0A6J2JF58_BOMMA|nr:beta-1,4-galactosyltransferase 7-like [Bombyx mandarina]
MPRLRCRVDSRCLQLLLLLLAFLFNWCSVCSSEVESQIPTIDTDKKRLAIIVPFRDRFEELLEFVPHMTAFLKRQEIPFHIFVIQQKDKNRFNRASLINVGFLKTRSHYEYIAMHDVDLLPLNDNLKYEYPEKGPCHIPSPETHPKYSYKYYAGGIVLVTREHYELVNGMSNQYWGWGMEDDEFYVRLKDAGLTFNRPSNITTGRKNTFRHIHDDAYRVRDKRRCYNQLEMTRRRDRRTGLHDVAHRVLSLHTLTIDGLPLTVLSVELICDRNATPWCQCPETREPEMSFTSNYENHVFHEYNVCYKNK